MVLVIGGRDHQSTANTLDTPILSPSLTDIFYFKKVSYVKVLFRSTKQFKKIYHPLNNPGSPKNDIAQFAYCNCNRLGAPKTAMGT